MSAVSGIDRVCFFYRALPTTNGSAPQGSRFRRRPKAQIDGAGALRLRLPTGLVT
jgi:hypothetical protein